MSNYLMKSTGAQAIKPTELLSREDIINVDSMYKVRIHNKSNSIAFTGFIPPDFSFSLASNWTNPYADTTLNDVAQKGIGMRKNETEAQIARNAQLSSRADIIQRAATMGGASSFVKMFSAKKWAGPSYLSIDLPIFLDAYSNSRDEVVKNIIGLLSMCAPSEKLGILVPPGPIPINQLADSAIQSINQAAGSSIVNPADDAESFTVDIGNFFSMSPCVVDSVSANFDNVWEDGTGNPISVDFVLQISSYFAVTREDLAKWLSGNQHP